MAGRAPDFALADVDGNLVRSSSFNGQVVLVNFWATWCPPCLAEIPNLQALHGAYQAKGFQVIGIAIDSGGAKSVKAFVRKMGMSYPVLMGNDKVARDYGGIVGVPTTFLVDRSGAIVRKFLGEQERRVFEEAIKKVI